MYIKNSLQNWFGNKKVLGTSLNVENIIVKLGERRAPSYILENFLSLMEDSERSLSLATRYKCHRYIIEFYVSQKDKASLLNYKSKITPQSEDYFFLEKVLCSTVILIHYIYFIFIIYNSFHFHRLLNGKHNSDAFIM